LRPALSDQVAFIVKHNIIISQLLRNNKQKSVDLLFDLPPYEA
jgi:hypothetical protein